MIEENKVYTIHEMIKLKTFPWLKDKQQYYREVTKDRLAENILKAKPGVRGERGIKYQIKGSDIIKFQLLKGYDKN